MHLTKKRTFLHDAVDIVSIGTHALEADDFNRCFHPISRMEMDSSGIFYILSFSMRYFVLFPIRLILLLLALSIYALLISFALLCRSEYQMYNAYVFIIKSLTIIIGARLRHYGSKSKLDVPHIFVSNHTSFIDFLLLSSYKIPHACVSENHGGLFSFFFKLILGRNGSIAFKRSEKLDRALVKERMRKHIACNSLPMLVFPEGTCVNNKYSVMFQKGVFELDVVVCPVSIKYKRHLMDPYWNRRKQGFAVHLLYLMTRWYIEAEIHWLAPVSRKLIETPAEYAFRVKMLISQSAQIKNTLWNGYLKSSPAIKDRELLKVAYKNSYINLAVNNIPVHNFKDKFYVNNIAYDNTAYFDSTVFGKYEYKTFINEVLKEYHILKGLSSREQELLINNLSRNNLCVNPHFKMLGKKICSCTRKKLHNKFKKKRKYKLTSCKIDLISKER